MSTLSKIVKCNQLTSFDNPLFEQVWRYHLEICFSLTYQFQTRCDKSFRGNLLSFAPSEYNLVLNI